MDHLLIHANDDVLVLLKDYQKGETIEFDSQVITLKEDVARGHKIALHDIQVGEPIHKYGFPIGFAKETIELGSWVHTHNTKTTLDGTLDYEYKPNQAAATLELEQKTTTRTFKGFVRKNGEVGIRNEIWVINTVGCINKTAELVARLGNQEGYENIDGVYHYPHPFGCSQLGDDLKHTQAILSNLVQHPNAAGVLVLGLGCENNYIDLFKEAIGDYDARRVKFLSVQEAADELEEASDLVTEIAELAKADVRTELPASKLKVGLKCGGSDGLSGITANPLVGAFSDRLIAQGGSTILTEVPEMFGAETILMNRAADEQVFTDIVEMVNGFKDYFIRHGQVVYENPSPGNKKGGITTLEEKSLGCVQKGGFAPVADVLPYGGRVRKNGLTLVQGPGNDLVSVTALAAAGAHIVLFTTGRGTPFGGPVPTVKLSTNTPLYERKKNWIDFNAGQLVEGKEIHELADELLTYVLQVASGEITTHNERNGFKEIALFKDGVIL
ncbi:UxaA family hydrolase [Alkalihalobacillus sp. 1P02AB]|uniref:UxaA family hydrolase n=1 Tax=Alkalihalobacillus sp. 1P02AB TaxID=3132260 RepID=UPI0039A75AEE